MSANAAPFRIAATHDVLLCGTREVPMGIYQLHLATAEQLTRLHYSPGSIKAIKARLKALTDNGYLQADVIPSRELRKPYYYALTPKGMRYLEQLGVDTEHGWKAPKEFDRHGLFIQHSLEINDILIAAALIGTADPCYHLHEFQHERTLKRRPIKLNIPGGETTALIPDAYLEFRMTLADRVRRMPVLLEHDRDTEEQQHFRRRIQAYVAFLRGRAYETAFGTGRITVAFTTFAGERRLEQMRAWTRLELAESRLPRDVGLVFTFAALARPVDPTNVWLNPCWYSTHDEAPAALLAT